MLSEEQQQIRAKGLGGSEIAAVVGISPFDGAIDVWMRKTGRAPPKEETEDMRRGKHLGPAIVEWYADEHGHTVTHYGKEEKTHVHQVHSVCIATPDGIADGEIVVEAKSPRRGEDWGPSGTDDMPDYYIPQVVWEMAATGLRQADVVALIYGELRVYRIEWSDELFGVLLEEAERFWRDHVVTDKPPPISASKDPEKLLRKMYPRDTKGMLQSSSSTDDVVAEYIQLAESAKLAENRLSICKAKLIETIGDHEGLAGPWGKITYRNNKDNQKTDWKAVADEMNAPRNIIQKHTTIKPGARVFRPKFSKEAV